MLAGLLCHIQVSLLRSLYSVQFTRRKTELSGVSIREESKVTLRACIFKPLHLNTEELFWQIEYNFAP